MSDISTKKIAICMAGVNEEYNDVFLRSFSDYAREYHFEILVFYSFSSLYDMIAHDFGERNIFQLINYNLIDGMIIMSQTIESYETIEYLISSANAHDIPVLSIDSPHQFSNCYNVNFDYANALKEIISHIIEKHHVKRINFIAGIKDNIYSNQRLNAYIEMLKKYNLPVEPERVGYGDFWENGALRVLDRFLHSDLPFPEAIVCANDSMALAVYKRLSELGYSVPGDVIVTGFDGISEALQHTPMLTTSKLDYPNVVMTSYNILRKIFNKEPIEEQIWIKSCMFTGGTCGCKEPPKPHTNELIHSLYKRVDASSHFDAMQMRMIAELTENNSFQDVFEGLKRYSRQLENNELFLCIVDNFLTEEEFSDILEETTYHRSSYSSKMDLMLYRKCKNWMGIIDFDTASILPNLDGILAENTMLVFFPIHVQEQTIGYSALSYDNGITPFNKCYLFFTNVSISLEMIKSHRRQQTIIENLENKYIHDPMTGLLNRRGFYQRVGAVYKNCVDLQKPFMIVSADLNGLKPINDTYGHSDGDIAITTIGKALMNAAQNEEICARFGGDEFVVAGELSDCSEAQKFIDAAQAYLDEFNKTSGKPYEISSSFGVVAAVPEASLSLDAFINEADEKMYSEKAKHHLSRGR